MVLKNVTFRKVLLSKPVCPGRIFTQSLEWLYAFWLQAAAHYEGHAIKVFTGLN